MSLCDKCFAPGACCRELALFSNGEEVRFWLDEGDAGGQQFLAERSYPFEPTWYSLPYGGPERQWFYAVFECPKLVDGRCSDYENRPGLCSRYEPKSCALCVMFAGESGDPTLGFEHAITEGARPVPGDFELPAADVQLLREAAE